MVAEADRDQGHGQRPRHRAAPLSAYFDTSAFLKLVIVEPGTEGARRAWTSAGTRSASVALIAEARAGLAAAHRSGRSTADEHAQSVERLARLWDEVDAIAVTEPLALRAGELAELCALRGYDAIHLASAEAILDNGDVMVVSDERLAEAAASLGIEALIPTA